MHGNFDEEKGFLPWVRWELSGFLLSRMQVLVPAWEFEFGITGDFNTFGLRQRGRLLVRGEYSILLIGSVKLSLEYLLARGPGRSC